jgi:hypothetical protein
LFLSENGKLFDRINKKFKETSKSNHFSSTYHLDKVYELSIPSVEKRWNEIGSKLNNIMQLWHGSSPSNLLSIMKKGLVIPEKDVSVLNSSNFGIGAYFAPSSTKSLNYATGGVWSSKVWNKCWMFLVDVALNTYYVPSSSSDKPFPRPGFDSIWAQVGKTSGLQNDEVVVFSEDRFNLVYLCEFSK